MIRSVKIASNDINSGKLLGVEEFLRTYNFCVNYFIRRLWSEKIFEGQFVDGLYIESAKKRFHLTSRLIQCAGKQALEIVKSQRKKTENQKSIGGKEMVKKMAVRCFNDECKYNLSHDVDSERHPHFRAYYCNHPKGILIGQSECDEAEFVCRSIDDPEGSEKRMMEG